MKAGDSCNETPRCIGVLVASGVARVHVQGASDRVGGRGPLLECSVCGAKVVVV
jgi:hypothetical protein